uniref:Uncharacterized protein n=1 Tax=Tetradesmus obliquus TaxID=3088 RepID=A0A383VXC4_TETOB|eukprot:jgi/Sobl393_1/11783/SZX69066.1
MYTEPNSTPQCGGATACSTTRVVQCLPRTAVDCPTPYILKVFRSSGAGPATAPDLVECRVPRSSCDLTAAGMTAASPNAGIYSIAVRVGATIDGCVAAGTTVCPSGYPIAGYNAAGELQGCR